MKKRASGALIAAVGLGLLLGGCDHMYGGMDKGLANVGAVKRGENLYDVVYLGDDKATGDFRRDMALMQSAQLCKAQGYKFFKASDTQVYSNHAAPKTLAAGENPQVTLQVSCHKELDADLVDDVDTVIDRISAQYTVN